MFRFYVVPRERLNGLTLRYICGDYYMPEGLAGTDVIEAASGEGCEFQNGAVTVHITREPFPLQFPFGHQYESVSRMETDLGVATVFIDD